MLLGAALLGAALLGAPLLGAPFLGPPFLGPPFLGAPQSACSPAAQRGACLYEKELHLVIKPAAGPKF